MSPSNNTKLNFFLSLVSPVVVIGTVLCASGSMMHQLEMNTQEVATVQDTCRNLELNKADRRDLEKKIDKELIDARLDSLYRELSKSAQDMSEIKQLLREHIIQRGAKDGQQ
jgi:hypothetical protein